MVKNDRGARLNEFIVRNNDLELLEARIREFNPLRVLNIVNYEIRHSNILSWLLSPDENHGLGDKFLKKMIGEILLENEALEVPFSVAQLQSFTLCDAQVLREYRIG